MIACVKNRLRAPLEWAFSRIPVARAGFKEAAFLRRKVFELQTELGRQSAAVIPEPDSPVFEADLDGLNYVSPAGDFTSVVLAYGQPYEPHLYDMLMADAAKSRNVVDVGANIGLVALPLARVVQGNVYCFDLSPRNAKFLHDNARRNGLDNIKVFPIAASDRLHSRALRLKTETSLNVANQFSDGDIHSNDDAFVIPFAPLDDLLADAPPIDLLKFDVDGWDYQALRGALKLIDRWSPVIYTEYCPFLFTSVGGTTEPEYLRLLTELGYEVSVLGPFVPTGPAPTTDPEALAAFLADVLATVSHTAQMHIDLRWERTGTSPT